MSTVSPRTSSFQSPEIKFSHGMSIAIRSARTIATRKGRPFFDSASLATDVCTNIFSTDMSPAPSTTKSEHFSPLTSVPISRNALSCLVT